MNVFRAFLAVLFLAVAAYTIAAIANDGFNLFAVFFGNLFAWNWSGQFNLDFLGYLWLSGLWIAWRGGFTRASIALGVLASVLGILFFAPYLLVLGKRHGGDMRKMLLGSRA